MKTTTMNESTNITMYLWSLLKDFFNQHTDRCYGGASDVLGDMFEFEQERIDDDSVVVRATCRRCRATAEEVAWDDYVLTLTEHEEQ